MKKVLAVAVAAALIGSSAFAGGVKEYTTNVPEPQVQKGKPFLPLFWWGVAGATVVGAVLGASHT